MLLTTVNERICWLVSISNVLLNVWGWLFKYSVDKNLGHSEGNRSERTAKPRPFTLLCFLEGFWLWIILLPLNPHPLTSNTLKRLSIETGVLPTFSPSVAHSSPLHSFSPLCPPLDQLSSLESQSQAQNSVELKRKLAERPLQWLAHRERETHMHISTH